jgi:carboxypeptidase family protein
MQARFAMCVLALVAGTACNNTSPSPAAPDPAPPVQSPQPPVLRSATISGVVRTAGTAPVSGAHVVALDESGAALPGVSAVTDSTGVYRLEGVPESRFHGALLGASVAGFFADHRWMAFSSAMVADFTLDPLQHIVVGETVRGRAFDSRCTGLGYGGDGGNPCQRFAVTPPASGRLVVILAAPDVRYDLDVANADGTFAIYLAVTAMPARVEIPAEGGVTYQIRVISWGGGTDFELTTSVQ